jgi:hypothetical protein
MAGRRIASTAQAMDIVRINLERIIKIFQLMLDLLGLYPEK